MITLCTCIAAIARFAAVTSSLATGRFAGGTEPLSNVRYVRWFGEHMLTASFTARDPEQTVRNCTGRSYLAFLFSVSNRSLAAGPDEAGF